MRFVETAVFTRQLVQALEDDHYRALQLALVFRPEQGALIKGSGGLRKLRWAASGRGKRGGARIIYYWHRSSETFYMLFLYTKQDQGDLTPAQARQLGQLVRKEFR